MLPLVCFGTFSLVVIGTLAAIYRKERVLGEGHVVVSTVTELRTGRRGARTIKYQFVALDGKQYRGESGLWAQRVKVGDEVPVLYNPVDPAVNLPSPSFLFYSFPLRGSE